VPGAVSGYAGRRFRGVPSGRERATVGRVGQGMDGRSIGVRVRSARLGRGLTLETVAGLAGHSKSWLSKVERGLLPLESRHDLAALAEALQVSPVDLVGAPYDLPSEGGAATAATIVQPVRLALLGLPDRAVPPVEVMRADLETLTRLRQAHRLDAAARTAAGLLAGLRAAQSAGGRDVEEVLRLLVWCCYETASLVRELRHPDLALLMAGLADEATAELAEPACLAVTELVRVHTLSSVTVGAYTAAIEAGTAAADAVRPLAGTEALAGYGSLMLSISYALAVTGRGRDALDRITEAGRVADRLTEPTDMARHLAFSAPGIGLHRLSVAVELGDPDAALTAASRIEPERLPYQARRASYWLDLGRAHSALRDDREAVAAFRRAEQIAPLRLRMHPLAREAVAGMLGRAQRAAVGRDLRGLAHRMGMPH